MKGVSRSRGGPETTPPRRVGTDGPSLVALAAMNGATWDAFTRGSAIRRAGYEGFRRNVVAASENRPAAPPSFPLTTPRE